MIASLARVRGRLEAARGRLPAAEAAFRRGLVEAGRLPMPFGQALVELAYGQVLRRAGHRRAASNQLRAARDRLAVLRARPYLERCERELIACGLSPSKRRTFDPSRLTAQELAVARLVAGGMSNRQVAAELFISIKTVQFHLTNIYAKLGVGSRRGARGAVPGKRADRLGGRRGRSGAVGVGHDSCALEPERPDAVRVNSRDSVLATIVSAGMTPGSSAGTSLNRTSSAAMTAPPAPNTGAPTAE